MSVQKKRPGAPAHIAALEADELFHMKPMTNSSLWMIQGLLTLLFLFTGGMKLSLPAPVLQAQTPLPVSFMRFIGMTEVLGAIGLMLPGLLRIRPGLTVLAAAGLSIIMIGATVVTLRSGMIVPALLPVIVGILTGFVAWGRWRLAPLPRRHR